VITYTATNTKTGKFYIGSALNYFRYTSRFGYHHNLKPGSRGYTQFHQDLQSDPLAFKWEWSEDELDTREWESTLIELYKDSSFLYNQGQGKHVVPNYGRPHTEDTKKKIGSRARDSDARPEVKKALRDSAVSTNAKKVSCPHCGLTTNPGNLAQHIKHGRCKAQG
jgi:hypothetical protein